MTPEQERAVYDQIALLTDFQQQLQEQVDSLQAEVEQIKAQPSQFQLEVPVQ